GAQEKSYTQRSARGGESASSGSRRTRRPGCRSRLTEVIMPRILVAEDEPHILLLIQRKLETAGYSVTTATNGRDALEIALRERPDLLLLDILMPEIEGLAICKEVKETFGDDAPPVIIISALGQQIDVEAGISAGADDYIIKPFSPRVLLERVEAALYR